MMEYCVEYIIFSHCNLQLVSYNLFKLVQYITTSELIIPIISYGTDSWGRCFNSL